MGGKFEGVVTVKKEEEVLADITIKKMYREIDNGYEEITRMPDSNYIINEEKSTCTNNATPTIKNNKLLITNLSTSGTECNIYFDKDNIAPEIINLTTSVTKTSIAVTVTASDNVGVTEYWYQIGTNAAVKGTGNTHTFTGLSAGTTYTIKVYVKDASGNQSDTTTKSVTTSSLTAEDTLTKLNITSYKTTVPDFSQIATTDEGIFRVSDGMYGGYSYYWRGAATTNYVKFAGFCWRIVRINGDGSLRLIYDGTTCHANGTGTTESIAVVNTEYNTGSNQSNYVGWTYEGALQRPSSMTSGIDSNAKTQLESWYNSNIGNNAAYSAKVADGKYCNDRNVASVYTWAINGSAFYYAGYARLYTNYTPTLSCSSNDVYTLKVGLITADEVEFAGGKNENNTSYYLYNRQQYWTMSPYYWNNPNAWVFLVTANGMLQYNGANATIGLRPVINLKSDTTFTSGGNGTRTNPYVVS